MTGVLVGFACELNHFPESTGPGQEEREREEERAREGGERGAAGC